MPIDRDSHPGLSRAAGSFLLGTGLTAVCLQTVLGDAQLAGSLVSRELWSVLAQKYGATRADVARGAFPADFATVWLTTVGFGFAVLFVGAGLAAALSAGDSARRPFGEQLARFAFRGWLWWLIPGLWEMLRIVAATAGGDSLYAFLAASLPMWLAVPLAGCCAEAFRGSPAETGADLPGGDARGRYGLAAVGLLCAVYAAVFMWMNRQLYFGLHIPHGDSAMYEEHLWNVWHGKGFRSYLDDGRLFLGEHLQVVHLLLLPLHWLWPSHLTLELCESLALASGAIPVFWMARRAAGSAAAPFRWPLLPPILLAGAYLLFAPLHYLDVAIDLKTFRPTCFGAAALLFALDQMERRRYRSMLVLLIVALSAKEDYAVLVSCIGLWTAFRPQPAGESADERSRRRWWGVALAAFGAVYLLFVIKVFIPAFRGDAPHYARYFGELGNTPGDVARSLLTRPDLVAGRLFSSRSLLYAVLLLAPVGFLPLRSPGRVAVGLPWFGMLCLLTLTEEGREPLVPWHHFHAPLVPVLFWSAAAGLAPRSGPPGWLARFVGKVLRRRNGGEGRPGPASGVRFRAAFAFCSALFTGAVVGFSPLSVGFWDAGSQAYWKSRYVPGERAAAFPSAFALVPQDARVFSTDFVHTRFTHHARSYDYSDYPRKSDAERIDPVPGETYFIVIDLKSRYSRFRSPDDVPELQNRPDDWEVLPHAGSEYFLVLRRRD